MSYILINQLWSGFNSGAACLWNPVINAVIDYDAFLSGKKREAIYAGEIQYLWKLVRLPSEVIPFVLMDFAGFDGTRDSQNCKADPDDPTGGYFHGCQNWRVTFLLYLFCWYIPAIFESLELILLVKFPLRERRQYANIVNGMEQHKNAVAEGRVDEPMMCPLYGHYVYPPANICDAPKDRVNFTSWVRVKE